MKKKIKLLPLLAIAIAFVGCQQKTVEREIASEKVERIAHLNNDKDAPYCDLSVEFEYLKNSKNLATEAKINSTLIADVFGAKDSKGTVKETIEKYGQNYVDEYTNSLEPLYLEEIKDNNNESVSVYFMYELKNNTKLNQQNEVLISFVNDFYIFTGGAHGVYATTYYNYDATTGEKVEIDDIFKGDYETDLTQAIYNAFKAKDFPNNENSEEVGFFNLKELLTPSTNFNFTEDGIEFIYGIYEIAPYSSGEPRVVVPYNTIKEILNLDNQIVKHFSNF